MSTPGPTSVKAFLNSGSIRRFRLPAEATCAELVDTVAGIEGATAATIKWQGETLLLLPAPLPICCVLFLAPGACRSDHRSKTCRFLPRPPASSRVLPLPPASSSGKIHDPPGCPN